MDTRISLRTVHMIAGISLVASRDAIGTIRTVYNDVILDVTGLV